MFKAILHIRSLESELYTCTHKLNSCMPCDFYQKHLLTDQLTNARPISLIMLMPTERPRDIEKTKYRCSLARSLDPQGNDWATRDENSERHPATPQMQPDDGWFP